MANPVDLLTMFGQLAAGQQEDFDDDTLSFIDTVYTKYPQYFKDVFTAPLLFGIQNYSCFIKHPDTPCKDVISFNNTDYNTVNDDRAIAYNFTDIDVDEDDKFKIAYLKYMFNDTHWPEVKYIETIDREINPEFELKMVFKDSKVIICPKKDICLVSETIRQFYENNLIVDGIYNVENFTFNAMYSAIIFITITETYVFPRYDDLYNHFDAIRYLQVSEQYNVQSALIKFTKKYMEIWENYWKIMKAARKTNNNRLSGNQKFAVNISREHKIISLYDYMLLLDEFGYGQSITYIMPYFDLFNDKKLKFKSLITDKDVKLITVKDFTKIQKVLKNIESHQGIESYLLSLVLRQQKKCEEGVAFTRMIFGK